MIQLNFISVSLLLLTSRLMVRCSSVWRDDPSLDMEDGSSRIINGINVKPGEFPSFVNIKLDGDPFCGGSLIADDLVLTAAHCLDANDPKKNLVTPTHLGQRGDHRHSAKSRRGEKVCQDTTQDIGVLRLERPMKLDDEVSLAKISYEPIEDAYNGQYLVVASGQIDDLEFVKNVQSLAMKRVECGEEKFVPNPICLMVDQTHRTCAGDSGSPIYRTIDGQPRVVAILVGGSHSSCELYDDKVDITFGSLVHENRVLIEALIDDCTKFN